MTTTADNIDRRTSKRFEVCDGAFAFINNTPFTIRNVSEGGMRLQSVVFEDAPQEDMTLDIFLRNENFYLQDIPVRLVNVQENHDNVPFSRLRVRCIGLQFGKLTAQQKTRLDFFISQTTTGEA